MSRNSRNIFLRDQSERSREALATKFTWYLAALLLLAAVLAPSPPLEAQTLTVSHFAGSLGGSGYGNGPQSTARFYVPRGAATDPDGNIYVADRGNHTIRKISPDGTVTTLAGLAGIPGSDDGIGTAARFRSPGGLATDALGSLYVADTFNHTIRRITQDGTVTTFAGLAGVPGSADGIGSAARFYYPAGVATDALGNLYVADTSNHTIREITPAGTVTTLAGLARVPGSADGIGSAARFYFPGGVATDALGNLYVADTSNHTIRRITQDGTVTTFAGLAARFRSPGGLATDALGNLYVADTFNHTIRRITQDGTVTTLAGLAGVPGSADGVGSAARFFLPVGVATDALGNLYVADTSNHTIRRITQDSTVTTLAGFAPSPGSADGIGTAARFDSPFGVATDAKGNVYVADYGNHTIRKITPEGVVTTLAGLARTPGSADGIGTAARFRSPGGVATDALGNLYVADTHNYTIRKITPDGTVTTLAGLAGVPGSADGIGTAARFHTPTRVATDAKGNVYVADYGNYTIRRITQDGTVTTIAGLAGVRGSDDGIGSAARFFGPSGVATDGPGNIYVADTFNHTIRRITQDGTVTTLAGLAGVPGSDDGIGSAARFFRPVGLATDGPGNIYVADRYNHTIRRITQDGTVTTVAGLALRLGSDDGIGTAARFRSPAGVATDALGNLYVADSDNHTIRLGVETKEGPR